MILSSLTQIYVLRDSSLWSVFAPGWDTQYKVLGKGIFSLEYPQNPTADQWTHRWPGVRSILYIFTLLIITKKPQTFLIVIVAWPPIFLPSSLFYIPTSKGSSWSLVKIVSPLHPLHPPQSLWCCPLVYGTQTVPLALGLSTFNPLSQSSHYP